MVAEASFRLEGPATGPEVDAELDRARTPELGPANSLGSATDGYGRFSDGGVGGGGVRSDELPWESDEAELSKVVRLGATVRGSLWRWGDVSPEKSGKLCRCCSDLVGDEGFKLNARLALRSKGICPSAAADSLYLMGLVSRDIRSFVALVSGSLGGRRRGSLSSASSSCTSLVYMAHSGATASE